MAHSDPNVNNPDGPPVAPSVPVAPQYQPQAGAAPVERPTSVTRAVQLMYVGAALGVVGIILAWTTRSQLNDVFAEASTDLSADQVEALVTASLIAATVIGLLSVLVWLWMAWANGAGKSWARVVATVLGGLNVLSTVYSLTSGSTAITTVTTLLSLVIAIAILVLLWRPASSAYFQARSAQKV